MGQGTRRPQAAGQGSRPWVQGWQDAIGVAQESLAVRWCFGHELRKFTAPICPIQFISIIKQLLRRIRVCATR
jgi:hypothetical protein